MHAGKEVLIITVQPGSLQLFRLLFKPIAHSAVVVMAVAAQILAIRLQVKASYSVKKIISKHRWKQVLRHKAELCLQLIKLL